MMTLPMTLENPRLSELAEENMEDYGYEGHLNLQFGQRFFEIPYREINPDVSYIYRSGYCAYMALAIHEITELPIAVFTVSGSDEKSWSGHVAIKTGDDEFLDIRGFNTAEEIQNFYGYGSKSSRGIMELKIVESFSTASEVFYHTIRHEPWNMLGELEKLVTIDYAQQIVDDYL